MDRFQVFLFILVAVPAVWMIRNRCVYGTWTCQTQFMDVDGGRIKIVPPSWRWRVYATALRVDEDPEYYDYVASWRLLWLFETSQEASFRVINDSDQPVTVVCLVAGKPTGHFEIEAGGTQEMDVKDAHLGVAFTVEAVKQAAAA